MPLATAQELRAVEEAQRAAQARLGLLAAYLVLRDWSAEGGSVTETASGWISPALRIIMAVRRKSSRLARRYYRLARAIETGSTLGLPDSMTEGSKIKMEVLRDEYREVLQEIADLGTDVTATDPDEKFFEQKAVASKPAAKPKSGTREELFSAVDLDSYIEDWLQEIADDDGDFITVDPFDWAFSTEEVEGIKKAFEAAIKKDVIEVGDRKIKDIRQSNANSGELVVRLEEQKDATGSAAAGRVDRYGINAGRDVIDLAAFRDRKVRVVARGLGPNPCSFCAMLASRGFVFRSKYTATAAKDKDGDIKRYHDNCHCYPIVRFVDVSELPAANQWLMAQWPIVTKGTHTKVARAVWRKWWRTTGLAELRKLDESQATESKSA